MTHDHRLSSISARDAAPHPWPVYAQHPEPASRRTPGFYVQHWDREAARARAARSVMNARMFAIYVSLLALATIFAVLALYQGERRADALRDAALADRRTVALEARIQSLESMNQGLVDMVAQLYPGDAVDLFARLDELGERAPSPPNSKPTGPIINKVASMPLLPTRHAADQSQANTNQANTNQANTDQANTNEASMANEDARLLTGFETASGGDLVDLPDVAAADPVAHDLAADSSAALAKAAPEQTAPEQVAAASALAGPAAPVEVASVPVVAPRETGAVAAPAGDATTPAPQGGSPTSAPQTSPAPLGIVLRAKEETWVQILDGKGASLFTKLMKADDIHAVAPAGAMLITGNPTGLEILVDGTAAPALNDKGPRRREIALDPARLMAGTAEQPAKKRVSAELKAQ